jgi:hypothetical protein
MAGSLRSSYSTRSLSNHLEDKKSELDLARVGLKVKDDIGFFDASLATPHLSRCTTAMEGYSQGYNFGPSDKGSLGRSRNNLSDSSSGIWTVAEDYPLMKGDYRRKALGHQSRDEASTSSSPLNEQMRMKKQDPHPPAEVETDASSSSPSPNLVAADLTTQQQRYPLPMPLSHENVPVSNLLPQTPVSRGSRPPQPPEMVMYLPPVCTMSDFRGGVPSLLTHEIVAFISRVDNYDVTWRR